MEFTELACIVVSLVRRRRRLLQKRRRYWVHPIVSQRLLKGQFHNLYPDLRTHPDKFLNYFRMSVASFDELLASIGPAITFETTNMRKPISPEERLAVTLRCLASGNSFASLHYEYLLGRTTIGSIVKHTCKAIWAFLRSTHMGEKTQEEWEQIAEKFYEYTSFPNCIGAIDGKHIWITNPNHSGSQYFNYKSFFSIVLLGFVDADYCFIAIDVGAYGKSSDSNVFKNSVLGQRIRQKQLYIPPPKPLPHDDNGRCMPHVIVGDEAFALSRDVMRPYPNRNLSEKQRIFNYRLTRARRMVECAFGILANKWRILHKAMDVDVEFAQLITQTCCVLHNFVRKRDGTHYEDTLYDCSLDDIARVGTRADGDGISNRDYFADYFISPRGEIPWKYDKI